MSVKAKSIEELLYERGILTIDQMKSVWDIQRESNKNVVDILIENNFAEKRDILIANAELMGMEFLDLRGYEVKDENIPKTIPENMIRRYCMFPVDKTEDSLTVAMHDPNDLFALDDLRLATSLEIKPVMALQEDITALIEKIFKKEEPVVQPAKAAKPQKKFFESGAEEHKSIFKTKIGEILVDAGTITEDQLNAALEIQSKNGGFIGEILVKEGFVDKAALYNSLQKQMNVSFIDLEGMDIPTEVVKLVSDTIARKYRLVPVEKDGMSIKVAMSDPLNIFSIDDLRLSTGMEIIPLLADPAQIDIILDKHFEVIQETKKVIEEQQKTADLEEEMKKVNEEIAVEIGEAEDEDDDIDINDIQNAPIVKMVNITLNKAITAGASDIHIEPSEDDINIRFRIDGQLVETMRYDRKILSPLVARVKIISGLNIAEKRIPQDGRISMKIGERNYDLRVSVLPTVYGEKIVIRISDKQGFNISKKDLGFFDDDLAKFDEILSHPHGIVLVTGPTGSGKTTTLYTALKELSKPNVNVLTVEDPVESIVKGINQVQVNQKAGLTFAAALRSFLRQDPDIIMLGEIRDSETAEIATRAAITGHLVLSTLHTNDAPSSISRLIDMGIEPFMISSSIVGVIAQRLVRRLCVHCRKEYNAGINEKVALKVDDKEDIRIYMPEGCEKCNNTGYKGRIAIYEIMNINRELREIIAKNTTSDTIKQAAVKNGMMTLRDNCARLVREGITSVDEMIRVTFTKE